MKYTTNNKLDPNLLILKIDSKTVQELKHVPTAEEHRLVLQRLNKLENKPRSLIYTLPLLEIKGEKKEIQNFAELLSNSSFTYYASQELEFRGEETNKVKLPPPYDKTNSQSCIVTKDTKYFGKDGITRRLMIEYQGRPLLPLQILKMKTNEVKGIFEFLETFQLYVRYQKEGSFQSLSFVDILNNTVDPKILKNKIVFLGTDLQNSFDEYISSPVSSSASSTTLMEAHANNFNTLIYNNAIIQAPEWLNVFFILLITILVIEVVFGAKPLKGLIILASTLFIFTLVAYLAFWAGVWIKMAQVYLSIFLTYYFFIPYRLIQENRRSWEYFQKHKLLTEVEQLKTNFISMMSHDLKTPIARIQGMSEMILKDPNPLSSPQRDALDTIRGSGDDLLKFINSILQYGRIESQGVELHLQSKDINTILEEVILKHEFLARLKHIQILKNLEPLFPIPVDPDLMKQVFSNLIENAIKYSPEKTIIQVKTYEKNDKVYIQVSDQGPGIPASELQNIFLKFFRSQNAKSSNIKGSGLGLYLAKYFTELHFGLISVETKTRDGSQNVNEIPTRTSASEGDMTGSTFTVELPITHVRK